MKRIIKNIIRTIILSSLALIVFVTYHHIFTKNQYSVSVGEASKTFAGEYLSARFAKNKNDYEIAAQSYISALAKSPKNSKLLNISTDALILSGNINGAISLINENHRKTSQIPNNLALLQIIDAVKYSNFDLAHKLLETMGDSLRKDPITKETDTKKIISAWVEYALANDELAIANMKQIPTFVSQKYFYQRALFNDAIGQKDLANEYFQKLLVSKSSYRNLLAAYNFYKKNGDLEKATTLKNQALQLNKYISSKIDYLENRDITLEKRKITAQFAIAEFFIDHGAQYFSEHNSMKAMKYLQYGLHINKESSLPKILLAKIFTSKNKLEKALEYYEEIDKNSIFYLDALPSIAIAYNELGKKNYAIELLQDFYQEQPSNNYGALLNIGDILVINKEYSEAIEYYTKGFSHLPDDSEDKWTILYARGICYERTKNWALAEADFQQALKINPNQPDVLNYLAYSWIISNKNFAQAEQMLRKALSRRPFDAHIIDSYGWALYKLGRYNGALIYLERANFLLPHDATTNDHLGDVYWRVGRYNEAVFQWKRALKADPEEEDLDNIRRKISFGLNEPETMEKTISQSDISAENEH